jgi:hypothetical protein
LGAHSRDECETRTWSLRPEWKRVNRVVISRITASGREQLKETEPTHGKLCLGMDKQEALVIVRKDLACSRDHGQSPAWMPEVSTMGNHNVGKPGLRRDQDSTR